MLDSLCRLTSDHRKSSLLPAHLEAQHDRVCRVFSAPWHLFPEDTQGEKSPPCHPEDNQA